MKKITLLYFLFIVFAISCTQDSDQEESSFIDSENTSNFSKSLDGEVCYSCDDKVDLWVKVNSADILEYDRSDFIALSLEKQMGAYRVMKGNQRKNLWLDKVNYMKEQILTTEEAQYFNYFHSFLNSLDFESDLSEEKMEMFNTWFLEGQKSFGWTDTFRKDVFYSLKNLSEDPTLEDTDTSCNCRGYDDCGTGDFCVSWKVCQRTFSGCGFLDLFSCTGVCD